MLAMVCSLATAAFATDSKPKKLKKNKQCTQQQNCKPSECKPTGCCSMPKCAKA